MNQFDAEGTFKGKLIGSIYEGGGAAGRAILDDFKAPQRDHVSRREAANKVAMTAEAVRVVTNLQTARAKVTDPLERKEIDDLVKGITAKYGLSDGNKAATSEAGRLLAAWRLQAEQLVFAIERLIDQTSEAPLAEAMGRFAGRIRMQYNILSEQPPPRLNFEAQTQLKDKRDQAIAAIVQLESGRDKTDDPTLRRELDRMSGDLRSTYGIIGAVSTAPREQAGWRHSISPLP